MAESKSRKKNKPAYTPPPKKSTGNKVNPAWFVPVMCALLILGLVWIVVTYLAGGNYPIPGIGNWNLFAGFTFIIGGLGMATQWR